MKYDNICFGRFLERPNRFIAKVSVDGKEEIVHVKNTGRCRELLIPGTEVLLQRAFGENRKTKYDLISVRKGERIINIDSQAPNHLVSEWLQGGGLFRNLTYLKAESVFGNSRFDFYAEGDGKKAYIEVKGVTLERENEAFFPDAPTERGVKHVMELVEAVKMGYDAYLLFVVQMEGIQAVYPNEETHPAFGEALRVAEAAGVRILALECSVSYEEVRIVKEIPFRSKRPRLMGIDKLLLPWYEENRRILPWREEVSAYRTWISEIMLQQTRVEAVKPYFERFLKTFPEIRDLAGAEEETLLKAWEGLGYYNRVRNMQKAAIRIEEEFAGEFPDSYEEIRSLPGIGDYTAGAIASIVFGIPRPAADGNVFRVLSRVLEMDGDIMKLSTRREMQGLLSEVIPAEKPGDFNQALIELGALICVPNGEPKCESCPLNDRCKARLHGVISRYPVKSKEKARRIEKRTVLIFKDETGVALQKRPNRGLLAGLYELPALEGEKNKKEVIEYCREIGLAPIRVQKLQSAKHIFSHIEWRMSAYLIRVDELEKNCTKPYIFAKKEEIEERYPLPSAFSAYEDQMKR